MRSKRELRPLQQFARLAPNHSIPSNPPVSTHPRLSNSPPRKHSAGWRTGGYYTNSGLLNAYSQGTKTASTRRSTSISTGEKSFHVNVELKDSFEVRSKYPTKSLITRSSVAYDPIFHTSRPMELPSTRLRLKGLGELLDRARVSHTKDTNAYQQALEANPKAFRKQSGEFSRYSDNCVRALAEPFSR